MFNRSAIIKALEVKGWSKYKLCKEAHMAQSTLSTILSGEAENPNIKTLQKIADALGVPVNDFFDNNTNQKNNTKLTKEQINLGYTERIIDHEKYTEHIILDNNGEPIDRIKVIKESAPTRKINSKWDNTAYRVSAELKQDDIDKIDEVVNALIDRYKRNNK